jgi:2-dehydro-3-deoxyphosphooctonate aldolase (KDO 8-P synthase)
MVAVGSFFQVEENSPLFLIAGPCQLESRDLSMKVCESLKKTSEKLKINFAFKSSYDKANRTSLRGSRGFGIEEGLRILQEIRAAFHVPIVTDIHTEEEASIAGEVVDVIQIPAFLCRQTDLLIAAGKTKKAINIKKGQFLHPADMKYAAEKVASTGNQNIFLCERGSCFGYRDLVVDFRGMLIMKESGFPVIFDATHSVQSMGGSGGSSSGNREYVLPLSKAAAAIGVDGLFIECHPDPDKAPSDGPNMVHLHDMEPLLEAVLRAKA